MLRFYFSTIMPVWLLFYCIPLQSVAQEPISHMTCKSSDSVAWCLKVEKELLALKIAVLQYGLMPLNKHLKAYQYQVKLLNSLFNHMKGVVADSYYKQVYGLWKSVLSITDQVVILRTQIERSQRINWQAVGSADDYIDDVIQANLHKDTVQAYEKEKAIREIEVSIWEANNAANYYLKHPVKSTKKEFYSQVKDVQIYAAVYRKLQLSESEKLSFDSFMLK